MVVLTIIDIIIFCIAIVLIHKADLKKVSIAEQQQKKQQLTDQIKELSDTYHDYTLKIQNIVEEIQTVKARAEETTANYIANQKQITADYIANQQQLAEQKIKAINKNTQQEITAIHEDLQNIRRSAAQQKEQIQNELNKLKASLSAGVEARLREQQKKDKINFYKLSINDADLADVKMLENLKTSFHKPVVLSKLIWTQYFQKQMTELCDRVLGKKTVCGIYKITNLLTEQCYIGQSVNISDRWKQHCKCGLGIEASATNVLYNSMQKDGVWNFSFELLQECPRNLLNEKEAFWIDTYSSNIYGLNTLKGIKT